MTESANNNSHEKNEIKSIRERYQKRSECDYLDRYSYINPSVYLWSQEYEREFIKNILSKYLVPIKDKKLLEVGCGAGQNLLNLIKYGFLPENLTGIELLEDRVKAASHILPKSIKIIEGNALDIDIPVFSFDVVMQSTVFTSILDKETREKLAGKMWSLVKPGGGVLWYDFIYDNPRNKDVKGVTHKEIRKLFPDATISFHKITLAPPINRLVTKIHPSLYSLFNLFPFLRTHLLCWIQKD